MRITRLLLCLSGLLTGSVFAQSFSVKDHYVKREVYIPMRDGVKLFSIIYLPKDSSKQYPVLLCRTPYGIAPYGPDTFTANLRPSALFAKEGYIFVFQDVRGRMMSEGTFTDLTPHRAVKRSKQDVDESTDTYDCIDWLLKHVKNTNGKVGQWGSSYPGFYTAAGMIDAHPALKACSPQAPISDCFAGDDFHHNGALFLAGSFGFLYKFGQPRTGFATAMHKDFEFPVQDGYHFFLGMGRLKNVNQLYYHHQVALWDSITKHETYDTYWQERNLRPHLKNIKPAVLIVGGWFDAEDLYGTLQTYQAIEKQSPKNNSSVIMGPWSHGGWYKTQGDHLGEISFKQKQSFYFRDSIEFPFFNYYLKGKGKPDLPEAMMFETGSNVWKKYAQWPPLNTTEKIFYLDEKGKLSAGFSGVFDEFVSDPGKPVPYIEHCGTGMAKEYMTADQRFASMRPDVLVYQTDILDQDQTYAGPIKVSLKVSTGSTDADWIVKVIDVYPDQADADTVEGKAVNMAGYQMLVRGDVMRGKFRNSFEKPEPFVPDRVTDVNFVINDINHTFKNGHRLMVQVQSTWFPLVDRNPQKFMNIFDADEKDFVKATHRIYRGSSITLKQLN